MLRNVMPWAYSLRPVVLLLLFIFHFSFFIRLSPALRRAISIGARAPKQGSQVRLYAAVFAKSRTGTVSVFSAVFLRRAIASIFSTVLAS